MLDFRFHLNFNTKKVRLKLDEAAVRMSDVEDFNTKKVRLKPRCNWSLSNTSTRFQYQKGAIKTSEDEFDWSTLFVISIPKRCD